MKEKKRIHLCLYLKDEKEKEEINKICKAQKESKSSLFRKLMFSQKHFELLNEIKNFNQINKELVIQIKRYGVNLNQIAYHLNIDVSTEELSKQKLEKLFIDFSKIIKEYEEKWSQSPLSFSNKKRIKR